MTRLRHAAATHVGRVRKINEDSLLALPDQKIWVVSDGMGGHEGGDFASQTIVECIAAIPAGLPPADRMRALRAAIIRAHETIVAEAAQRHRGVIGATVVAFMLADGHFVTFWAGDSRLYRIRDGEVEMLTTDHSAVAELVTAGLMTWDEAERHPQANAITRAVGVGDELELDKIRGEVRPGDRYLLCTDGLTKYAGAAQLQRIAAREPIETVAERLVQVALDGGGADNVSVIVVDVR
jgi:protein phosphatase/serine/threonine-protein phosphatase Stp1